jgi:NADH-quinone oxidoreductase subunit L
MFHLMTHAFFKALLFLAAGVVIHALVAEQDIRKMGGLGKLMPKTYALFLVGGLALVGIPPFSGFFSKDPIIASALARGGWFGDILYVLALVGALLTGVYTFRLIFRVFGGQPSEFVQANLHRGHGEGPLTMLVPVGILGILATVGGWLQVPGGWHLVSDWLDPVAEPLVEATTTQEAWTSVASVALGVAGIAVAWWIYSARRSPAPRPSRALEHKLYFDELYDALFFRPAVATSKVLYALVEGPLVAGSISGLGEAVRRLGTGARSLQTGLVRTYALAIAASLAVLALVFIAVR